jgi:hypothetical protein
MQLMKPSDPMPFSYLDEKNAPFIEGAEAACRSADSLLPQSFPASHAVPSVGSQRLRLILVLFFFLWGGCATDSAKPSPVAIEAGRLQEALLSITESYEKKDEKTFFSKFDPAFQPLTHFKSQVLHDFKRFSEANIRMVIERIQIDQEAVMAAVRWDGTWKTTPDAPALEKKGHALFRWTGGENPQLLEIRGDPPFGIFTGEG